MRELRLLQGPAAAPAFNLALDEALLLSGSSAFRLYSWDPPGLSLGYFQRCADLPLARLRTAGFEVVRRPTGGGAIAHVGELTFSLTGGAADLFSADVRADTERLHQVFVDALESLGGKAEARGDQALPSDLPDAAWLCFYKSSPLDLVAAGRKLLGSAARRVRDRVLHHGSLPLAPNPVTSSAISVEEVLRRPVKFEEVAEAVCREFAREYGVRWRRSEPTPEERRCADELVRTRYATAEWTERR